MHRVVIDCPLDRKPDHKNGNGLDNRECNLRVADDLQNSCNQQTK